MWLTAALLLTMVSGWLFLKSLYWATMTHQHYNLPSTGRIQQLAYHTNLEQGATKLLKLLWWLLRMVKTFQFDSKFSIMVQYLIYWIQNKKTLFAHCTALNMSNIHASFINKNDSNNHSASKASVLTAKCIDPKPWPLAIKPNLLHPSCKTAVFFLLSHKTTINANMVRCRKNLSRLTCSLS